MTKFYEFRQNNSGGNFDVNDYVCHVVVIEAVSAEEANVKAEDLGIYFGGAGDCPCCGDRWYEVDEYEGKAIDSFNCDVGVPSFKKKQLSEKFINRLEPYPEGGKFCEEKIASKGIEEYYQLYADMWGWTSPDVRIYYMDGAVKSIYSNTDK